jgi:hypothetical protein
MFKRIWSWLRRHDLDANLKEEIETHRAMRQA